MMGDTGAGRTGRLRRAGAFATVVLASGLMAYPLCHVLYRCGCAAPWSGGDSACNVHGPSGPRCPWCEHRALGAAAFGGIVVAQGAVFELARRRGAGLVLAAVVSASSFAAAGPLVGALSWSVTDYPHFVVPEARRRLGLPPGPLRCEARPADGRTACCR